MFPFLKRNAAIDAFAREVADDLARRFPAEGEARLGGKQKKPVEKFARAIADLERRVVAFRNERALGVYGKARLLNAIKWQLREKGYTAEFVEATTTTLAGAIGRKVGT